MTYLTINVLYKPRHHEHEAEYLAMTYLTINVLYKLGTKPKCKTWSMTYLTINVLYKHSNL